GRLSASGWAWAPRSCGSVSEPLTAFKLARVTRPELPRPVALVTIDNGADHTKPTIFGRPAFESLDRLLSELEAGDWAALVITGKPYFFSAGAALVEITTTAPAAACECSRAGQDLLRRLRSLP